MAQKINGLNNVRLTRAIGPNKHINWTQLDRDILERQEVLQMEGLDKHTLQCRRSDQLDGGRVLGDRRVGGEEQDAFHHRLSDEQAIEGVLVDIR